MSGRSPGRAVVAFALGWMLAFALPCLAARITPAGGDALGYAPVEDAARLFDEARATAAAEHKQVLVMAGGDWCRWCHVLDAFLSRHPDIRTSRRGGRPPSSW